MIIISKSKSIKQPFLVTYKGENSKILATSELLKSKRAAWKNIYALSKVFLCNGVSPLLEFAVKDLTVDNPEVFVYDINGIKKKAGVRK